MVTVEHLLITIAVPLATMLGFGLSLWVRDKARQAAQERLREMMKGSLAEFKSDLMVTLNGTYVRHDVLRATIAELNATMAVTMSNIIASRATEAAAAAAMVSLKAALTSSKAAREARKIAEIKHAADLASLQIGTVIKRVP